MSYGYASVNGSGANRGANRNANPNGNGGRINPALYRQIPQMSSREQSQQINAQNMEKALQSRQSQYGNVGQRPRGRGPPPPQATQATQSKQATQVTQAPQQFDDSMFRQNILLNKEGDPKSILFYSKHCQHSQKFANALYKNQGLHDNFIKICIDARGQTLPEWLRRVPTIVVFENNKREILTDRHAFEWLKLRLHNDKDIESYNPSEMSSKLSDVFAYLDNAQESEHNFAYIDAFKHHIIITPGEESNTGSSGGSGRGSGADQSRNMQFESNFDRYKQQRELDVPANPNHPKPGMNVDFTKGYVQNDDVRQPTNFDLKQVQSQWKKDHRRLQPPQRAPNFQSSNFRTDSHAQSNRGSGYQNCGLGAGGDLQSGQPRNYDNYLKSRKPQQIQGRRPPPNFKPNFQYSAQNIKIV